MIHAEKVSDIAPQRYVAPPTRLPLCSPRGSPRRFYDADTILPQP